MFSLGKTKRYLYLLNGFGAACFLLSILLRPYGRWVDGSWLPAFIMFVSGVVITVASVALHGIVKVVDQELLKCHKRIRTLENQLKSKEPEAS